MRSRSLTGILIRNTSVQLVAQAVSVAVGLVTSLVLSRYLGVEGFGQFNYVFAFLYFFQTINDFGVNTIIVREVSREPREAGEIIGGMISLKLLVAAASVAMAWVTIGLMHLPPPLGSALSIFVLILPIIALQLPGVIFQVLLKPEYPAIVGILNRGVGLLLVLAVVATGRGLVTIVMALLTAEVLALVTLYMLARRFVMPRWRIDAALWRRILRSSLPLGLSGIAVALINRIDFLMLERMTDMRQVGLYGAAYKITNLLEMFPLIVMGTLYPVMSRYAAEDPRRAYAIYLRSTLTFAAIAVPMGIAVSRAAPLGMPLLFGAAYADSARALSVLVWATVCLYIALTGGNLLISIGRERTSMALSVAAAALNVALNLVLIPRSGFVGAAQATAATFLFLLVGVTTACYRALHPLREAAPQGWAERAPQTPPR